METKFNLFNRKGDLLKSFYDENRNPIKPKFDKFGRLQFDIFDKNGHYVYNENGEQMIGLYDSNGNPLGTVYDELGREVWINLDDEDAIHELYDKLGRPIYNEQRKVWDSVNNIVEGMFDVNENKRQSRRIDRRQFLTQNDKIELMNEIDKLRQQMNVGLKDTSTAGEIIEDKSTEHKGIESEIRNIVDLELEKNLMKEIQVDIEDDLYNKVDKNLDEQQYRKDDNTFMETPNTEEAHTGVIEDLECLVTEIFLNENENHRSQFEEKTSQSLVLIVQVIHELLDDNNKLREEQNQMYDFIKRTKIQVQNEIEDICLELDEQYDRINNLEELTKSKEIENYERKKNLIENDICMLKKELKTIATSVGNLQIEQDKKINKDNVESIFNDLERKVQNLDKQSQENLQHIFELIKENKDNLISNLTNQSLDVDDKLKTISDNVENKVDKQKFEKFDKCLSKSVENIRNYINKFIARKEAPKLSAGRTPLQLECKCLSCGRYGVMNDEHYNLPELDLDQELCKCETGSRNLPELE